MRDFGRGNGGPRRSFDKRGGDFGGERQSFKAVCADCGRDCDLPFEPRGNRPVYCRDCFKNHPQEERPARFDSRGPRRDGKRDSRGSDRPMFSAVCSNCGKTCQLPFEPRSNKPVFCSDCFEQKEKGQDLSQRKNYSNGTQASSNAQLDAINSKLDKILNLLSNTKALKADEKASKEVKTKVAELVRDLKTPGKMEDEEEAEVKAAKPKKAAKKAIKPTEIELTPEVETPVAETPTE